jgi:hypothetical protein
MKVIVYVEGPSDQFAMESLLKPLIERARQAGKTIQFIPSGEKRKLLIKAPTKAANILRNDPGAIVIVLPDLYPPNVGIDHETFAEMRQGLETEFERVLARKCWDDQRLHDRFKVFCFKYELEALVLAAEEALAGHVGGDIPCTWTRPVEDQNHARPPARIVEQIFAERGDHYRKTVDAPQILGVSNYTTIAKRCPQCFGLFVSYLESLVDNHV